VSAAVGVISLLIHRRLFVGKRLIYPLIVVCCVVGLSAVEAVAKMVYITVPTVCHRIEKVEEDKVYIISPSETDKKNVICAAANYRQPINLDDKIEKVQVYIDGVFAYEETPSQFDIESVRGVLNNRKEFIKELEKNPFWQENKFKELGEKKALETYNYYKSEEFQNKVAKETERLKNEFFSAQVDLYKRYEQQQKENKPNVAGNNDQNRKDFTLSPDERVYVFISSSVPLDTLRNYARAIDRLGYDNIFMVMRGFVGGMKYIRPTIDFISSILKKDSSCDFASGEQCEVFSAAVNIDPLLFRAYNISEVPAIVYARGVSVSDSALSEGLTDNATYKDAYVVYGDVSIEYAVKKIKEEIEKNGGK